MLSHLKGESIVNPPTPVSNPALLEALEIQERQLGAVLGRLEGARRDLIPAPATFWRGSARHTYDAGIDALRGTVDAGIAAVTSARYRTTVSIAELVNRDAVFAEGGQMTRV
jgi:hypothetical protein